MRISIHIPTLDDARGEVYSSDPEKQFVALEVASTTLFLPGSGAAAAEAARKVAGLLVSAAASIEVALARKAEAERLELFGAEVL
jgi:hypothetical protein